MLVHERPHFAPSPPQSRAQSHNAGVSAGHPRRERRLGAAYRILLGLAYALHPQRVMDAPALLFWTTLDILRGRTEIPDQTRTRSRPDTFGGVVRSLTPETYMTAVRAGFFPWAHCGPLKWWTRKNRLVLSLSDLRVSRSVKRLVRKGDYRVTFDTAFAEVLTACAAPRPYNWHALTWLTPRFIEMFNTLHRQGFAHSFEVWNADGELVGGGFGVAFGGMFVGESMFSREPNTSKIGFAVLVAHLEQWGFTHVDGRDHTPVMERMGFRTIPRAEFEALLKVNESQTDRRGPWHASPEIADEAAESKGGHQVRQVA